MTVLRIPAETELWELVAAVQICQAYGMTHAWFHPMDAESRRVLELAGIHLCAEASTAVELPRDRAYRQLAQENRPYQNVVAALAGLPPARIGAPRFPRLETEVGERGGIVVAPFEVHESFRLPWQAWKKVIRHLRTYGVPVTLMGRPGQRADYASFTEGTILCSASTDEKLCALAQARLVLGVPNEWTWMAAAWNKKIIVLHPDDIPHERWFGFDVAARTLGRLLYQSRELQVPVILAGLRRLISVM